MLRDPGTRLRGNGTVPFAGAGQVSVASGVLPESFRGPGTIGRDRPAGYENAAADCSVSSEPRKNTILPSAKRHQCCMFIAARLPVAFTV